MTDENPWRHWRVTEAGVEYYDPEREPRRSAPTPGRPGWEDEPFRIDQRVLVTDPTLDLRDEPAVVKALDPVHRFVFCDVIADTSGQMFGFTYAQTKVAP